MTGPTPRIGVLALQGDVREHLAMLGHAGVEAVAVRRPSELAACDGLVIPGGESTTMVKLARIFDLLDPLRDAVRGGLPAFGTCAGMILLADRIEDGAAGQETVGGLHITVRRNAFGRQVASFEAEVDVKGVDGGPVSGAFIRAPWVAEAGPGVEVLAELDGKVVAVRQGGLLATAFHPELTGEVRLHRRLLDLVAERGLS